MATHLEKGKEKNMDLKAFTSAKGETSVAIVGSEERKGVSCIPDILSELLGKDVIFRYRVNRYGSPATIVDAAASSFLRGKGAICHGYRGRKRNVAHTKPKEIVEAEYRLRDVEMVRGASIVLAFPPGWYQEGLKIFKSKKLTTIIVVVPEGYKHNHKTKGI